MYPHAFSDATAQANIVALTPAVSRSPLVYRPRLIFPCPCPPPPPPDRRGARSFHPRMGFWRRKRRRLRPMPMYCRLEIRGLPRALKAKTNERFTRYPLPSNPPPYPDAIIDPTAVNVSTSQGYTHIRMPANRSGRLSAAISHVCV
jgi:hypothetical protein